MNSFNIKHRRNVIVHPVELQALTWLGQQEKWTGSMEVKRRSDRLFDLDVIGVHMRWGSPTHFVAWFPLACLHNWWGDRKWVNYLPAFDDWSQMRDMARETQWAYFNDVVQHAMRQAPKVKAVSARAPRASFQHTKAWLMVQPEHFIRRKGRRGVTTICKIWSAKTGEYVATLIDTPEEIVARVDVVPRFQTTLTLLARKHPSVSFHMGDEYALSEFLRDFTEAADRAWMRMLRKQRTA